MLLLVNPASRVGTRRRRRAAAAFAKAGVPCHVLVTDRPGHAAELTAEHGPRHAAVFTLGGDGTAMEAIGTLASLGRPCPVGILAGGTGNLLARTLAVPLDVTRAVPRLLAGDEARVDLGRLQDGRRFAFAAGVGIDVSMIADAPASLKRRIGVGAYAWSAARAVLRRQTFRVRATVDGRVHERDAVAVMIANFGAVLNAGILLGPGIHEDDGLLDLCIFSPRSGLDSLRILFRLYRRDFRNDRLLLYAAGRNFRIETDVPRGAEADGELIGNTPLEVVVEPLAASVLIPRPD